MVTRKPEEELILVVVMLAIVVMVIRRAGDFWGESLGPWAVDHGVLLAAAKSPLVAVPGLSGAGLDVPRLALAGAFALVLVLLAGAWARNIAGAFARQRQARRVGPGQ